jgi:hypothetical protein
MVGMEGQAELDIGRELFLGDIGMYFLDCAIVLYARMANRFIGRICLIAYVMSWQNKT